HEAPLDLSQAAAELGLTPADLLRGLDQSPDLARGLGVLKVAGGTVQRQAFAQVFPVAVKELKLGRWLAVSAPSIVRAGPTPTPGKAAASTNALTPMATIDLKAAVGELIVSKSGKWVYLLNMSDGQIQRIATDTHTLDAAAAKLTDGTEKMRMSPDGAHLY